MDALQAIVDLFGSLGSGLIAALFGLVAVILVWLIARASRRGSVSPEPAAKRARNNRYHPEAEAGRGQSPAPPAAAFPEPPAASPPSIAESPEPVPAALNEPAAAVASEPQDSVLHRHYEAELAAKKEALAHPYPTDSVLRRHYDTLHALHLDAPPTAAEAAPKPAAGEEKNDMRKASIIEQAVKKETSTAGSPAAAAEPAAKAANVRLPQDSVLKRHFLCQLQAEISAGLSPRPTDSVLRRHYDGMVRAELEKRLRG